MIYFYESHLGGNIFTTENENFDDYCEQCGDSDRFIGCADNKPDATKLILDWYGVDLSILDGLFGGDLDE